MDELRKMNLDATVPAELGRRFRDQSLRRILLGESADLQNQILVPNVVRGSDILHPLRKAAMKESEKSPDTDFSKIEGMSKQSKTEGLQPGPGSDD